MLFLAAAEETIRNRLTPPAGDEYPAATDLPKYDLPPQHALELQVPIGSSPRPLFQNAATCLQMSLSRMLRDLDLGSAALHIATGRPARDCLTGQ